MIKSFEEYIVKGTKLTPSQLAKPNSLTGEKRIDILKESILKGEPLQLYNGGSVVIANSDYVMEQIDGFEENRKPIKMICEKGNDYSSSDLLKSSGFGGGAGAGGGSINTQIVESAQCLWIAAMLSLGTNVGVEEFTRQELSSARKHISVDAKYQDMVKIDESWVKSSYLSAKCLIEKGYVTNGMKFHRNSKLVKSIYEKKNRALANSNLSRFMDDKWNPGDIWAVTPGFKLSEIKSNSLTELNQSINDLFQKRRLVAISLKKVNNKAKDTVVNLDKSSAGDHVITGMKFESTKGDFWSSKQATILFDSNGQVELRPNSYLGSVKSEIRLKGSRGGSAGWNYMIDTAKSVLRKKLPMFAIVNKYAVAIAKGDQKRLNSMYNMYKGFYNNGESPDKFSKKISKKDEGWISAKLAILLYCSALKDSPPVKANRALTMIINYAGSKSEDASTYVKISN